MRAWRMAYGLVALASVAGSAQAAKQPDCPFTGVIPGYTADDAPDWRNWDALEFTVADADAEKTLALRGAVCTQNYGENAGKTDGSTLEILENVKAQWQQEGAELKRDTTNEVVANLNKDGKEYWLRVTSTRDDGYSATTLEVAPFHRTLLPPSGQDYRLIGHMPTAIAQPAQKKNFDAFEFPTEDGSVTVKGALTIVDYDWKKSPRTITPLEVVANYHAALTDLNAEFLREQPDNLTARLDDNGKTIWIMASGTGRIVAVEEKPFVMSIQSPQAAAIKNQLDTQGHIALYVNFDFNKATLKPDAAPVIAQVVALMKANPDLKVTIEGHTDNIGMHDYNQKLSEARAAAVVAAVAAGGVDAARMSSAGFGPDKPIAPNETDAGRAKNRRVELVKN